MTLGQKLYELRKASGLSQEQLAKQIDVSRQTISNWESDIALPNLEKIIAISDLFQISLDQLLKGEQQKHSQETSIEELAKMNWEYRKKTIAFIVGIILIVLGIMTYVLVNAITAVGYGLGYILYRYIVIGEYAWGGIESSLSIYVELGMILLGIIIIIGFCREDIKMFIKRKKHN